MLMRLMSGEVGGGQCRGRHNVCVTYSYMYLAFLMTLAIASTISLDEALLADMIPSDPDDLDDVYPSTGCGHDWLDVVYMCCCECGKWYDNRPSCIEMSREDAMRLKNGSVEMHPPGEEVIVGDTWTCNVCKLAEMAPDEEMEDEEG